jgi:hypothetical protein
MKHPSISFFTLSVVTAGSPLSVADQCFVDACGPEEERPRIFLTFVKGTAIAYHTKLWTWRVFVMYAIVVPFTNVRYEYSQCPDVCE